MAVRYRKSLFDLMLYGQSQVDIHNVYDDFEFDYDEINEDINRKRKSLFLKVLCYFYGHKWLYVIGGYSVCESCKNLKHCNNMPEESTL